MRETAGFIWDFRNGIICCVAYSANVFADVGRTMWITAGMTNTTIVARLAWDDRPVGALMHSRISDLLPDLSEPWSAKLGDVLNQLLTTKQWRILWGRSENNRKKDILESNHNWTAVWNIALHVCFLKKICKYTQHMGCAMQNLSSDLDSLRSKTPTKCFYTMLYDL